MQKFIYCYLNIFNTQNIMNLKHIMLFATVSACWAQYVASCESENYCFDHLDFANQLLVKSYIDELNKNGIHSSKTQKNDKKRKKLKLSAVFVAFDTQDLNCKIETCENLKTNGKRICHRHNNAKQNYERNPSIENQKFYDELILYRKQLKRLKPPKCANCGETNEKKFSFMNKKNRWQSWCNRCRSMCHEHSTMQKNCWKQRCVECKLAGKNQSLLCDAQEFCDKQITRNHAIFGNLCRRCFGKQNPNHIFTRFYKEKENAFYEVLLSMLSNITICPNFRVPVTLPNGQTANKYVDFRIETLSFIIDIEFDEEQHTAIQYNTAQQQMRSDLIYQALRSSGKQYIMLRLNPDKFTAKNGDKFRSCFTQKTGVKPYISDESQWKLRTSYFKSRLEDCMELDPEKLEIFPHVEHMFYDGFDTSTLTFDARSYVRKRKRTDE